MSRDFGYSDVIEIRPMINFPVGRDYCYCVDNGTFFLYSIQENGKINVYTLSSPHTTLYGLSFFDLCDFLVDYKVRNVYNFLKEYQDIVCAD